MNNKDTFKFIENFLNRDGISGFEGDIARAFINHAKQNTKTELSRDGFGSVIAKQGQSGPKILIASHMDEVGFLVQRIEKTGFLRLSPVGGHWPHTLLATKVKVVTRDNKEFYGVIGSTSVHILKPENRSKVLTFDEIYVDIGVKSKEEALNLGIKSGDPVVRVSKAFLMANDEFYCAKAIDNRIGVAVLAKVMQNLKNENLPNQFFAVATAQEEVGCRGAQAAVQNVVPDVAIALDTSPAHDTPNVLPGDNNLAQGVAIGIKDHTALSNPKLVDLLEDLAAKKGIKAYRYVSQGGGTDALKLQYSKDGIPVVNISLPTRYLHTSYEVGSIVDFNAVVDLLTEFLKSFDQNQYQKLLYKVD